MDWLANNIGTILVAAILAIIVILIIRKMIRDRRSGRGSCSCGCEGCTGSSVCGRYREQTKQGSEG